MNDIPKNANENCPGATSADAGKLIPIGLLRLTFDIFNVNEMTAYEMGKRKKHFFFENIFFISHYVEILQYIKRTK
ncbi:unnamed protein product [Onchocerca flexuosa]|uniref:Uncharacterized protein n=1 Tax=Onchocerca flexuosa TaxID=387005 RepID=A0A183HP09_9BILA|nr:unnamed protein product [Onchocerca flexuosa]